MGNNCSSKVKEATQKIGQLKSSISQIAKAASNIKKDHHKYVDTTNNKLTQISMSINEQLESIKTLDNDSSATLKEILTHGKIINDIFESMVKDLQSEIEKTEDEKTKGELTEQKQELEKIMGEFKQQIEEVEKDIKEDGKLPTEEKKTEFGKRKRRRRFGSLYCPKAIKGAYGRRKPSKTSRKFKKEIKRRRKTVKRKKPVKRRKTVKRKKATKRRKPVKRSSPNSLSGIFNIINPNSISKILQENPDIMGKINDLRQLKETGGFNPKELVVIAALSTLSDMTVEDASNQFSMLKSSGMKLSQYPYQPSTEDLHRNGKNFPPNYLHKSWMDYLYWDVELEA